jgi:cytochrome b6-f complex iron-sulfur subunit
VTSPTRPTRRSVLVLTGSGVGLAALAACSSSGDGGGSTAAGSAAPSSAASSSPSSPTPSSSPAASGTTLVATGRVPVGGGVSVTGKDGAKLIVTQPSKGQFKAMSAICTHMGCTVAPKNGTLDCPCHGSVYDLTGAVKKGPAPTSLPSVQVSVSGGNVVQG